MEDQLVGFFVRGFAVIAGDRDFHAFRDQPSFQRLDPLHDMFGYGNGIGTGALGDSEADRRGHVPGAVLALGPAPRTCLVLRRGLFHPCDVGKEHRSAAGGAHRELRNLLRIAQRLASHDQRSLPAFAHRAGRESAIGLADRLDEIAERHAVKRKPRRVRHDAQRHALPAGYEGQPDILDLGDFGAQLARKLGQGLVVPLAGGARLRRQCQHDDRHVVDPAHRHLRRRDADRDAVDIGIDLLVDADRRILGVRSHEKARGHHHPIVLRLRIDVLDPVHALDDRLQRLGHQLDRFGGGEAGGLDHDVDHRHLDLRLFLARDADRRNQPDEDRRHQEQGRERRLDGRPGQLAGNAEIHCAAAWAPGPISVSEALTPERISTLPSSPVAAVWTGTCAAPPSLPSTVT